MSADLELVADWERGDMSSLEWADPGIDLVFVDGPEPGGYVGRETFQQVFRTWLNSFADFRLLADQIMEIDSGCVLALTRVGGQGKTSGADLARAGSAFAHLFELRGGKVARLAVYFNRGHAFADLALAPPRGAA